MKKMKFLIFIILVVFLVGGAMAADKTFYIKGSGIKSMSNSNITVAADKILIYKNGSPLTLYVPGTSTVIDNFRIDSGEIYTAGNPNGRNVQIQCNVGDNLSAQVWYPNRGEGNYYNSPGGLSMNQTNFDDSSLTWFWNNLDVNYKAAKPYQPKITQFNESTTSYTDGRASSSSLNVSSAPGSGTDGLREITGYAWKMWKQGESEPTEPLAGATGATLSVPSSSLQSGTTYTFRVAAKNQWESGVYVWSNTYDYKVGGGGGGVASFTFTLNPSLPDKLIVNSIASPKATTALAIVQAINDKAGKPVVAAIYKWNKDTGGPMGILFVGENPLGILPDGRVENFDVSAGEGVQVYTTEKVENLVLQGQ